MRQRRAARILASRRESKQTKINSRRRCSSTWHVRADGVRWSATV
jgi:hypothetical protein